MTVPYIPWNPVKVFFCRHEKTKWDGTRHVCLRCGVRL